MGQRLSAFYTLAPALTASSSAGSYTNMVSCVDFRHAVINISAAASSDYTIKFYASIQETPPDLSSAASATNQYWVINAINLADGSSVPWNTWVVIAAAGQSAYEIQENSARWIGAKCTTFSAGSATLSVLLTDNE